MELLREVTVLDDEQSFQRLADFVPHLMWMANPDGWIYWYNRHWYNYTGNTPEEMEGWGWQSVHHPDELPRVLEEWQTAIRLGEPFESTFPLRGADGVYRTFLTRATPAKNADGKVIRWFGTNTDISAQMEAERALRESEERFRNLADTAPMYMAMADETGNAVYFNKPWLEFTGRKMPEMEGLGWLCTLHPEDAPKFEHDFKHAFSNQIPIKEQYRFRRADGEYRWMLAVGAPRITPDGKFVGYFGTYTDFHELKQAQEALTESEARFRTMADAAPVLIWMAGTDARCVWFNKSWLDFTGRSIEQEAGDGWAEGVHPDDRQTCMETFREAFEKREEFAMECRLRRHDGEYRWLVNHGVPRFAPDGTFIGYIGSCIDIHDRKEAEVALLDYASRLQRSNQELDQFATIASHDLQEPLRKVMVFGEMLAPLVPAEGREYIERMTRATQRMQGLISDLLTLSRVNRKGQPFTKVDLNRVAQSVLDDLQMSIAESGARVSLDELGRVEADGGQIRQLLQNLLSNALKYHKQGQPPVVRIYGKTSDDGRFFVTTVEDEGIGIREEFFGRIFEPFQRLHGAGQYPGTGMGLAICQKIVVRNNGTLTVESKPGQGSRFSFSLPFRQGQV